MSVSCNILMSRTHISKKKKYGVNNLDRFKAIILMIIIINKTQYFKNN